MKERIAKLENARLLYVIEKFKTYCLEQVGMEEVEEVRIKGSKIDYEQCRALIMELSEIPGDHQQPLSKAVSEAEKLDGPAIVLMMDPVSGIVTITGMILIYRLAVKIIDRSLPASESIILRDPLDNPQLIPKLDVAFRQIGDAIAPDDPPVRVVILTPKKVEFEAMAHILPPLIEQISENNTIYYVTEFEGRFQKYEISLVQSDSGLHQTATAAMLAIGHLKPEIILLTGNAGQIAQTLKIGDIVIGTVGYEFESGRELDDAFKARPKSTASYSHTLTERAKSVGLHGTWKNRVNYHGKSLATHYLDKADYYLGPIVSSNKVLEGNHSEAVKRIKDHFDDAIAVEMEAAGLLAATQKYQHILVGNIRCISDFKGDKSKTDQLGYKELAAAHAAAFAIEVLYQLTSLKKF